MDPPMMCSSAAVSTGLVILSISRLDDWLRKDTDTFAEHLVYS